MKYNGKEMSEILDKLSDGAKNLLIKVLIENDSKNVSIIESPMHNKIAITNGTVDITTTAYAISVTHTAEEYREHDYIYRINYVDDEQSYHTVDTNKDNFEETIYKVFANGGFEVKITCIEK